jgi:hypothetical protein
MIMEEFARVDMIKLLHYPPSYYIMSKTTTYYYWRLESLIQMAASASTEKGERRNRCLGNREMGVSG